MTMHPYDASFYDLHAEGAARSARKIIPLLQALFQPTSVLDVGCGDALWLLEWSQRGVQDYFGVDGEYVVRSLRIPAHRFLSHDLNRPLDLGRKFDIVTSLEVAEHIDPAYAKEFVHSLARHGDLVVFSAAIPGQFGERHVNEQFPGYWAGLFAAAGLQPFDVLRGRIWADREIEWWYRQNILVFCAPEKAMRFPALSTLPPFPLDIAHPDFVAYFKDTLRTDASIRLLTRKLLRLIRARAARLWHARRSR
jgi:SAM-dependent methyltransferase